MKRYPSIDFLRGFAIFMMVYLHTFMRWFDQGAFYNKLVAGETSLFLAILLIISLFFGSWAGFFLMVSALGNMISMHSALEKGQPVKSLVVKQVIGGFILLAFAYLAEGIIGYKGAIGEWAIGNENWQDLIYYRGYHMETIHAVAWCVILNGLFQGFLSINGNWKNIRRNIRIYAIAGIIIIIATQFVWWGFDRLVPDGNFSHGTDPVTGYEWKAGHLLLYNFWTNLGRVFWQPWAGAVEPIFPFLAVSFLGSIIALVIIDAQKQGEKATPRPLTVGVIIGGTMAIVGLLGFVIGALTVEGDPFDTILTSLSTAYDMTGIENRFGWLWLPYFLMVTGAQLATIFFIFRLVEFRGKAETFAKKTLFFRRFGFVAFSVYTFQFIDVIVVRFLTLLPGFPEYRYGLFNEVQIWPAVVLIFAFWYLVLKVWEKVDYALGMEWCIAKLSEVILPMKKKTIEGSAKLKWWQTPRLDPQASLHDAQWLEIIPRNALNTQAMVESKLVYKVSLVGFFFFPAWFIAWGMLRTALAAEKENKFNAKAKKISLFGMIFTIIILIVLFALNTSLLF
jgi:hypothetical protein